MPHRIRLLVVVLAVLLVAGLGVIGWMITHRSAGQGGADALRGAHGAAFVPFSVSFSLRDAEGRQRTLDDFASPWRLIYFGYSYCPDVCPTELAKMARALSLFEQQAGKQARRAVVPIFITIDPERDSPARLAEYLAGFGADFVGLTGSQTEIAAAARSFGVHYARSSEGDADPDAYLMEHSSLIFLVDARGRVVDLFTTRETPATIATRLRHHVSGDRGTDVRDG
ncbi:MAG: SCO family protein, partial [Alphaproteobacteria bacterium]